MNEECLYCGSSGIVKEKEVQIIKTAIDKKALKKEKDELQSYLHPNAENLYSSNGKLRYRKNKSKKKKDARRPTVSQKYVEANRVYKKVSNNTSKRNIPVKKGSVTLKHKENQGNLKERNI